MKVLGIVTARAGSKGVPRKNIRELCGKPLLSYTAEAALASNKLSRVVLSTEDEEIAKVGRACGLEVSFLRPQELARDNTPSLPVVQHAVHFLEAQGARFDAVCILQPTSPLRLSTDIDSAIEVFEKSNADSVVSVLEVPICFNPHKIYLMRDDGSLYLSTGEPEPISRRQNIPPAYRRNGAVYLSRRDVVMQQDSLYGKRVMGVLMPEDRSIDIDTLEDWDRAEALMLKRQIR